MARDRHTFARIPGGSQYSESILLDDGTWVALLTPDVIDGASISLEIQRPPDNTFIPHYDSVGRLIALPVAAARSVALAGELGGLPAGCAFRLKSSAVQSADRTLVLVIREN